MRYQAPLGSLGSPSTTGRVAAHLPWPCGPGLEPSGAKSAPAVSSSPAEITFGSTWGCLETILEATGHLTEATRGPEPPRFGVPGRVQNENFMRSGTRNAGFPLQR